jgi:RimJ/RimL family protein N-acetyltransferase
LHEVGLNVFVENHSARRVYEKTGFEIAEEWLTVDMV